MQAHKAFFPLNCSRRSIVESPLKSSKHAGGESFGPENRSGLRRRFPTHRRIVLLDEGPFPVLVECDPDLLGGVHHDGAVPGHRFADRFAGHEEKANLLLFGGLARHTFRMALMTVMVAPPSRG